MILPIKMYFSRCIPPWIVLFFTAVKKCRNGGKTRNVSTIFSCCNLYHHVRYGDS
jgi:hypothetical protein